MKTFKNKVAANNEGVSTVYFAQGEQAPSEFGVWEECDALEIDFALHNTHLFTQAGVRYYGKV